MQKNMVGRYWEVKVQRSYTILGTITVSVSTCATYLKCKFCLLCFLTTSSSTSCFRLTFWFFYLQRQYLATNAMLTFLWLGNGQWHRKSMPKRTNVTWLNKLLLLLYFLKWLQQNQINGPFVTQFLHTSLFIPSSEWADPHRSIEPNTERQTHIFNTNVLLHQFWHIFAFECWPCHAIQTVRTIECEWGNLMDMWFNCFRQEKQMARKHSHSQWQSEQEMKSEWDTMKTK